MEDEEGETRTKGGLIIPTAYREEQQIGVVLAVGPGKVEHGAPVYPMSRVGDVVMYGKYAGQNVTYCDRELLVLRDGDIMLRVSGAG